MSDLNPDLWLSLSRDAEVKRKDIKLREIKDNEFDVFIGQGSFELKIGRNEDVNRNLPCLRNHFFYGIRNQWMWALRNLLTWDNGITWEESINSSETGYSICFKPNVTLDMKLDFIQLLFHEE